MGLFGSGRKKVEGQAQYHLSLAKTYFEQWKLESDDAEKGISFKSLNSELGQLNTKYKTSAANHVAMLIRAEMAMTDEKWDEASQYYTSYVEFLSDDNKALGLFPLAKAHEQAGKFDAALSSYEKILKSDSSYEERALLGKARSLRELKRFEESEKSYEEFIQRFPDSTEISSVRGLLALTRQANGK